MEGWATRLSSLQQGTEVGAGQPHPLQHLGKNTVFIYKNLSKNAIITLNEGETSDLKINYMYDTKLRNPLY